MSDDYNDAERERFHRRIQRALDLAGRGNACPYCLALDLLLAARDIQHAPGFDREAMLAHLGELGITFATFGVDDDADTVPPCITRH